MACVLRRQRLGWTPQLESGFGYERGTSTGWSARLPRFNARRIGVSSNILHSLLVTPTGLLGAQTGQLLLDTQCTALLLPGGLLVGAPFWHLQTEQS